MGSDTCMSARVSRAEPPEELFAVGILRALCVCTRLARTLGLGISLDSAGPALLGNGYCVFTKSAKHCAWRWCCRAGSWCGFCEHFKPL